MRQSSEFYPRLVEVYICEEGCRRLLPFFVLHESPTSLLLSSLYLAITTLSILIQGTGTMLIKSNSVVKSKW